MFGISPLGQHRHRLRPHPPERHGLHRHGRRADHALHGRAALQTRPAGGHRRKLFILLQPRQRIRIAGLLFAQNGQRRADRDDRFDPHGAAPHHLPRSGRPPPAHQPRRGQRRRSVRHLSQADGCAHRRRLPLLQRLGSPQGLLRADYRQADPLAGAFRRRHPVRGKRDPLQGRQGRPDLRRREAGHGQGGHFIGKQRQCARKPPHRNPRLGLQSRAGRSDPPLERRAGGHRHRNRGRNRQKDLLHGHVPRLHRPDDLLRRQRRIPRTRRQGRQRRRHGPTTRPSRCGTPTAPCIRSSR